MNALALTISAFLCVSSAAAEDACTEPTGVPRLVSFRASESPTLLPAAYAVRRMGGRAYLVDFNVNVAPADDFSRSTLGLDASATDGDVRSAVDLVYHERIHSCLTKLNPRLRAQDGTNLQLRINARNHEATFVNSAFHDILIGSPKIKSGIEYVRDNTGRFTANISCETIVHELLHLTGLVDEYPEIERGQSRHFDCRSRGPVFSVMRSEGIALGLEDSGRFPLQAAQVRVILFPGCAATNETYYACARNAYRTLAREGCFTEPPVCATTLEWLR